MHFDLVDRVLELTPDRIVTLKQVSAAEEYLQDHFPTFPVLPGVLMLEALVQAGRRLIESTDQSALHGPPLVLRRVRALKYGHFVKPGSSLRVEVTLGKRLPDGAFDLRGEGVVLDPAAAPGSPAPTAVSGRFELRPMRR
jgi:3-hydroxyacyl-[acyl-carrier-protein] dehydratase